MTQLVLSIPDKKVKGFLKFLNDFSYVKVEEAAYIVPEWQKKEVGKRLKNLRKNPTRLIDHKDAAKYLKSLVR